MPPTVFDIFPLFLEEDLLKIRFHELKDVVDVFIVGDAGETFGGHQKPMMGLERVKALFPKDTKAKLHYHPIPRLHPPCTDRVTGRAREAYQRNRLMSALEAYSPRLDDVVIFSDLDEIPNPAAICRYVEQELTGVYRFLQHSYYYNINTLTDYGHDFASRARIGRFQTLLEAGSLYEFRMMCKNTEEFVLAQGGWHMSYFGGLEAIIAKVAAMVQIS